MNVKNETPMNDSVGKKPDADLSDYRTPERETKPLPGKTPGWASDMEKENER